MSNLAQTMAAGYNLGRNIGDDISEVRFNRAQRRITAEYEQRAAEEGRSLDEYLPEIEGRLREAGQGIFGADRRGVTGAGGQSLTTGALGALDRRLLRDGERAAAAQSRDGNHAGARDTRARVLGNLGQYDNAIMQQNAGDMIRASSSAMGADGTYDQQKGASALAGVNARYGDHDGASTRTNEAKQFRLQKGAAYANQLQVMALNMEAYSPDQVIGTYKALQETLPEALGGINLQPNPENPSQWVLYGQGGKAVGDWDFANNPEDKQEFADLIKQFTDDPATTMSSIRTQRSENATAARERDAGMEEKFLDARIDLLGKMGDMGMPEGLITKLAGAVGGGSSGGGSNGWQLQDVTAGGEYMIRVNGETYKVKFNAEAGPGDLPVEVFEADGVTPVSADVLSSTGGRDMVQTITDTARFIMAGDSAAKINGIRTALRGVDELEAQYRPSARRSAIPAQSSGSSGSSGSGGSGRRSVGDRNNNRGNVRDVGQFRGQPGYVGTDSRGFAIFDNPDSGRKASEDLLRRYFSGQSRVVDGPTRDVDTVVRTWAPVGDENSAEQVQNYVSYVSGRLGVQPGDQLDEADIPRLAEAMAEFETGARGRGVLARQQPPAPQQRTAPQQRPSAIRMVDAGVESEVPMPAQSPGGALGRRVALSPETSRTQRAQLAEAEAELQRLDEAFTRFQSEQGGRPVRGVGRGGLRTGLPVNDTYQSDNPDVARAGNALRERRDQALARVEALRKHVNRVSAAERRAADRASSNARAGALAAQYEPGMADFFNQ